jgi:hypothetical protein
MGELADPPGPEPGASRFEAWYPNQAAVAQRPERPPRKREARGSTPRCGSALRLRVLVAQRQRHQPEMLASVRSNRAEDTLPP